MRISTYDPDDPISPSGGPVPQTYNSVNDTRPQTQSFGQRIASTPQNYTEKTMLLSSDEENWTKIAKQLI